MGTLVFTIILWGGTFAAIAIDRRFRREKRAAGAAGVTDDPALAFSEPETGTLVAIGLLCNVACLPYYFGKTRRSALGALAGFGIFLTLAIVGTIANVGVVVAQSLAR